MLLEELKPAITQLKEKLDELKGGLKIAQKEERIEDLEHQMAAPGFWDDPDKAQVVAQEANNLKSEVETYHGLSQKLEDVETLWEMAMEERMTASRAKSRRKWRTPGRPWQTWNWACCSATSTMPTMPS